MQTTCGHHSLLNGKIECPHQNIQMMFNAALIDSGHHKNKWCLSCGTTAEIYNYICHSATNEQPNYLWFKVRSRIHDFRIWGCEVYVKNHYAKASDDRVTCDYFMGYTPTRCIIRWWNPSTNTLNLATGAKFNELNFNGVNGNIAPGCLLHSTPTTIDINSLPEEMVDTIDHPFFESPPEQISISLPSTGTKLGIELEYCEYKNLTYIVKTTVRSPMYLELPNHLHYNTWIVSINKKEPITIDSVISIFQNIQAKQDKTPTSLILENRHHKFRTSYESIHSLFHQTKFINNSTIPYINNDTNNEVIIPITNRIFQLPTKPDTPLHIGQEIKSPLRSEWLDSIFTNYEKMITTGTWGRIMHKKHVPPNQKIIRPRISFKVKLTEHENIYYLYSQLQLMVLHNVKA